MINPHPSFGNARTIAPLFIVGQSQLIILIYTELAGI